MNRALRYVMLALCAATMAAWAGEPETERIPVLATQLDGTMKFKTVKLPVPPEPLAMWICIQEFEAALIACYAMNTETHSWERFDLTLEQ